MGDGAAELVVAVCGVWRRDQIAHTVVVVTPSPRDTGARQLACVECPAASGRNAIGWRGYRIDDPTDEQDPPALVFYCPACAAREFGPP